MLTNGLRLLSAVCLLSLCGCSGGVAFSYHEDRPPRHSHVCTRSCHRHYYDGSKLVVLRGHHHGPDCGHTWNGTYWVRVRSHLTPTRVSHVCTRDCDRHYYDGSGLVVLHDHHHGPGCGHTWTGRYWVRARRSPSRGHESHAHGSHVCTPNCDQHYYDGTKLIVLRGHHHGPDCGHRWNGRYWVLAPHKGKAEPHRHQPVHKGKAPPRRPTQKRRRP